MRNLTELDLSETTIKELPSALVKHLKGLKPLDFTGCRELVHVPKSISGLSSLETIRFDFCTKLEKLPEDLGSLPCLQTLGLDSLKCELPCLSGLSSLKQLSLNYCNLMEERILNDIFGLSSLEELELKGNHFSSIPADISKLLRLRILDLSHCENLFQIPELPLSLRLLDAHGSPATLSSPSSLLNCFNSLIQELKCGDRVEDLEIIFIPGTGGIPNWVKGSYEGSQICIELPNDWSQDKHFLGIAIGCVYSLVDDESYNNSESEDESDSDIHSNSENESEQVIETFQEKYSHISLECEIRIDCQELMHNNIVTVTNDCECYKDSKMSVETWMMYYAKAAFSHNSHSDQPTTFFASFTVHNGFGKPLKVKKTNIGLVYDNDHRPRAHQSSSDAIGIFSGKDKYGCSECQSDRVRQAKLCLEGNCFHELPTIIESGSGSGLKTLCLRKCQNLESLPAELFCQFKSLEGLFCSGCSKLKRFPDIMKGTAVKLRKLHLDETAIEELPSSVEHLRRLQELRLHGCANLMSLPESLCNLKSLTTLDVRGCSQLNKLPENLGKLQNLEELYAANLDSISNCQLPCSSGLRSLRILDLRHINLNQGAIPSDICCLNSLKVLVLSYCNLIEGGIPSEIYDMSSLQALYLDGNHFCSIPAGINKLSELRVLNLSHCQKLQQIPELPMSLRFLDMHGCAAPEALSLGPSSPLPSCLFKCFKSVIKDDNSDFRIMKSYDPSDSSSHSHLMILVSSKGNNQEWIRCQSEGSKVSRKLPRNWFRNNDLLGYAMCSVHVPIHEDGDESKDGINVDHTWSLKCELTVDDGHQIKVVVPYSCKSGCNCGMDDDDNVSSQVIWVIYLPMIIVTPNDYLNNRWRVLLKAAFQGHFNGRPINAEKCGIHFIYANQQEKPSPP